LSKNIQVLELTSLEITNETGSTIEGNYAIADRWDNTMYERYILGDATVYFLPSIEIIRFTKNIRLINYFIQMNYILKEFLFHEMMMKLLFLLQMVQKLQKPEKQ